MLIMFVGDFSNNCFLKLWSYLSDCILLSFNPNAQLVGRADTDLVIKFLSYIASATFYESLYMKDFFKSSSIILFLFFN